MKQTLILLALMLMSCGAVNSLPPQTFGVGLHRLEDSSCAVIATTPLGAFAGAVPSMLCDIPIFSQFDFRLHFSLDSMRVTSVEIVPHSAGIYRGLIQSQESLRPAAMTIVTTQIDITRPIPEQLSGGNYSR